MASKSTRQFAISTMSAHCGVLSMSHKNIWMLWEGDPCSHVFTYKTTVRFRGMQSTCLQISCVRMCDCAHMCMSMHVFCPQMDNFIVLSFNEKKITINKAVNLDTNHDMSQIYYSSFTHTHKIFTDS